MTLNPDVYKKAQKVIDEQIGRDRLIEPDDRENLPYITCLLREVFRYIHPTIDKPQANPFFLRVGGVSLCHWVSAMSLNVTVFAQEAKASHTFRLKMTFTRVTCCLEAQAFSLMFGW